jgi:hypothetical protein
MTLANGISGFAYHRSTPPTSPYHLTVHQEDTLIATTREKPGQFSRIFTQLYRVEQVLHGAELEVPANLELNALHWRMLGQVALRESAHPPIDRKLERKLRDEAVDPPLSVGGRRFHLGRDVRPPWREPLLLLESRDGSALFVVSSERIAAANDEDFDRGEVTDP